MEDDDPTIEFVGNRAYSSYRLRDVITTTADQHSVVPPDHEHVRPDRLEADRELLRRFYLRNGYIDVRIVAAAAEFDPARNGS